jgi:hypothetical protein
MNEPAPKNRYGFDQRWHAALKADGFVQVSTFFLENYHRLNQGLTHGEAMFVIHLMQHKWGEEAPFPSYATIARRMAVSEKAVQRMAASLQQKKLLYREFRVGATNRFDLGALITALIKLKRSDEAEAQKGRSAGRRQKV